MGTGKNGDGTLNRKHIRYLAQVMASEVRVEE